MTVGTILRRFGLACVWVLVAAAMTWSWLCDPYDAVTWAEHPYGHNSEGALQLGIVVTLIELAVLYLLLQPWKRDRGAGWLVFTLVLLVPWVLFSALMVMHAGGIFAIHFVWVAVVFIALVGALVGSGVNFVSRRNA
jgi:FtsH-binding integral membrane protein